MDKILWVVEFIAIGGVVAAFTAYFLLKRRLKKSKSEENS